MYVCMYVCMYVYIYIYIYNRSPLPRALLLELPLTATAYHYLLPLATCRYQTYILSRTIIQRRMPPPPNPKILKLESLKP